MSNLGVARVDPLSNLPRLVIGRRDPKVLEARGSARSHSRPAMENFQVRGLEQLDVIDIGANPRPFRLYL